MDASERRTRAAAEAAEWWLQVQSDNMPQPERQKLVAWLRESPIHVEEMLRVAHVYRELAGFDDWQSISTEGSDEDTIVDFPLEPARVRPSPRERGFGSKRIAAIAASIVVIVITASWLWPQFAGHTITTERTERRELALADGSAVQMDPETLLHVRFDEHSRRIELKKGRAMFRVAKDPNRPFSVQAYDTVIRAVGTSFAVERKAQSVTVTVAEGRVAVTSPSTTKKPSASEHIIAAPILVANDQLTVQRSGSAEPVRKVNPQRELAWADGRLILDNDTVAEAVERFNHYNSLRLQVKDTKLAARTVSGTFDASDPESFVSFLQTVLGIAVDRSQGQDIMLATR